MILGLGPHAIPGQAGSQKTRQQPRLEDRDTRTMETPARWQDRARPPESRRALELHSPAAWLRVRACDAMRGSRSCGTHTIARQCLRRVCPAPCRDPSRTRCTPPECGSRSVRGALPSRLDVAGSNLVSRSDPQCSRGPTLATHRAAECVGETVTEALHMDAIGIVVRVDLRDENGQHIRCGR